MSYILDALKRAESERSRGAVPGVHAQPQAAPSRATQGRGPVVWIAAVLMALAAGAAVVWWLAGRGAATVQAPVPAPASVVAAAAAPAEVPAPRVPEPSPPAASVVERPAAVLPPIPPIPVAPVVPAAPPVPAVPVAPAPIAAPKAPAPAKAQADQPRISTLAELPDTVRQQLPALAISGSTYSENPLYRMVIVNGQVLHEGDTAAPGVVLDTIRQKDVVLRAQGYRFAMKY